MVILRMNTTSSYEMLETWRAQLWSRFVRLESESTDGNFYGKVTTPIPDSKRISVIHSTRQVTKRTNQNIKTDPQDLILVMLQKTGSGFIEQEGKQARLKAGDFAILDTTRPYQLFFNNPFEQVVMQVPRQRITECMPNYKSAICRQFDGKSGPGLVISGFIQHLNNNGANLSDMDLSNFESTIVQMLTTAMRLHDDSNDDERIVRLNRIKTRLLQHIRDPELNIEKLAAQEGMRLRTVQRLFQMDGKTPRAWLIEARLTRIAQDLQAPGEARRSITDIAFSWGFNDLSHFSHAFSARFKCSARVWRTRN